MRRKNYRRSTNTSDRRGVGGFLRRPSVQVFIIIFAGVIVYLLALGGQNSGIARDVSVDDAFALTQQGAVILDVREQKEWDEYHAPNSIFIPLGQLPARLTEIPRDKKIIVTCSFVSCSQQGRDTLLAAGFTQATSMTGSMQDWFAKGYPIEGAPPE